MCQQSNHDIIGWNKMTHNVRQIIRKSPKHEISVTCVLNEINGVIRSKSLGNNWNFSVIKKYRIY